MTTLPRSVLLVADRLGVHDDGWSVAPFLDRLEGLGLDVQVLCLEAAGDAAADQHLVVAGAGGDAQRPEDHHAEQADPLVPAQRVLGKAALLGGPADAPGRHEYERMSWSVL